MVGLIAHVDTSPDAPGAGVEPIVHRDHAGGADRAAARRHRGRGAGRRTTSSPPAGDTLLGADDKAGVAEIMTAVAHLAANPDLPRPTLRICFTPDEEIGEGATLFDVERFGAVCAYTLDGSDLGELQDETFAAEEVIAHHPRRRRAPGLGEGRAGQRRRGSPAEIVAALPPELTPERTDGRDGFIHVYELDGGSAAARWSARSSRDFDDDKLARPHRAAARAPPRRSSPRTRARALEVAVTPQYPNMRRYIEDVPAGGRRAPRRRSAPRGSSSIRTPIRGGTDGSRLSAMGLPTPNLFTGGHDYHSPREWASLQEMAAAAATVVRLAEAWARDGAPPPR